MPFRTQKAEGFGNSLQEEDGTHDDFDDANSEIQAIPGPSETDQPSKRREAVEHAIETQQLVLELETKPLEGEETRLQHLGDEGLQE